MKVQMKAKTIEKPTSIKQLKRTTKSANRRGRRCPNCGSDMFCIGRCWTCVCCGESSCS